MCIPVYGSDISVQTVVATYSLAHLLVALAVFLSIRATHVNAAVADGFIDVKRMQSLAQLLREDKLL